MEEEVSEIGEKEYGILCCVATSYCEPVNRDTRRCKNRLNSITASLTLGLTNYISAKKPVRKGVI